MTDRHLRKNAAPLATPGTLATALPFTHTRRRSVLSVGRTRASCLRGRHDPAEMTGQQPQCNRTLCIHRAATTPLAQQQLHRHSAADNRNAHLPVRGRPLSLHRCPLSCGTGDKTVRLPDTRKQNAGHSSRNSGLPAPVVSPGLGARVICSPHRVLAPDQSTASTATNCQNAATNKQQQHCDR